MAYANVLVLGLVFLSAILLHYLFSKKEAFQEAQRTPLTKENVQSVLDRVIQSIVSNYQNLLKDGEKSTDSRIRYRLTDTADFINALNAWYPELEYKIQSYDYSQIPSITLEDLNLFADFYTTKVGLTPYSLITDPANINDLDMLTNRIRNITGLIEQKAALIRGGSRMIEDYQSEIGKVLTNISNLKKNFGGMKATDIPILRIDMYYYVLQESARNFIRSELYTLNTIPPLVMNNLPAGKSLASKIINTITSTPAVSTPASQQINTTTITEKVITPVTTNTPAGMKFSELVKTLMSYGPLQSVQVPNRPAYVPNATDPKEVLAAETGSAAYLKEIKTTIRDEIKSQLKDVKLGPKDDVNKDLAKRSTEPVKPVAAPKADSDALQQGSWFRSAAAEGCPYAQGQASTEDPVPPFDMSQYIRKDKIPCWGCTLK